MKSRFAPSPTGLMTIGNARTALFSALLAWHKKGVFLLRIEDTDLARSEKTHQASIEQDLRWLGLQWQEGVDVGGSHGPYCQSERFGLYEQYYQQLEAEGSAYPCFCSSQQLELVRKVQLGQGQAPRYPGTCRSLSIAEREAKIAKGLTPAIRFKVPKGKMVVFDDLVKGTQRFAADDIGDFIIKKSDGSSSFMFCNAIDDALMEVTDVMRGEDHLTNTPRQILILEALKLRVPVYGHISLINGSDGQKLSKRNGSRSIVDLREMGFLAIAVDNYLARLGAYYENNALMNMDELAAQFKVEGLSKSSARYDEQQLWHWQKLALAQLDEEAIWQWMGSATQVLVPAEQKSLFIQTVRDNILFPKEAMEFAQMLFGDSFEIGVELKEVVTTAGEAFFAAAVTAVEASGADFKAISDHLTVSLGVKGKNLFQPLRVALTGQLHGPQMAGLVTLIAKERCIARFSAAKNNK
ncbi:MAG: glutamate--tRNA ligase [Gammaproteobacteria bacterium]|nr:glutamate--tRNA ligase [Gammaproteobacteria bacterium]